MLNWEKDAEMLNAVQNCIIMHLTAEESLIILESQGFKITKSKLRKIKRYLQESIRDRLDHIVYSEYAAAYIDAIDILKLVISRFLDISKKKKGSKEELHALALIPNTVKVLIELYDSNLIVASISEKLGTKSDVL